MDQTDNNMNEQEVNKDFQVLIEKYLNGLIDLEEVKMLVSYYESFQKDHKWVEELGSENHIKQRMLINILETLQEKEDNFSSKGSVNWSRIYKIVAVCLIAILIAVFVIMLARNDIDTAQIVSNSINIGSSKATLTLQDGTAILLGKNKEYKSTNVKSDGQSILYSGRAKKEDLTSFNLLTVPKGGEYQIKLSDGTKIWLNSESKLKYPVRFLPEEPRQVELVYGEAYFDVSPSQDNDGNSFRVINKGNVVEVLGTEFNIKANIDEAKIYTTVIEGTVAVSNKTKSEILKPNHQLIHNSKTENIEIKIIDEFDITAWKKGIFSFNDMPLHKIMKVLERWYDVDVIFENEGIENMTFNGILRKNQRIEDIISHIQTFNKLEYQINGKTITLR